jgi:hypothetical protein
MLFVPVTLHRPYQAPPTVDLEKSRLTLGCAALGLRIVYHVKKWPSASAMYSIRIISDAISASYRSNFMKISSTTTDRGTNKFVSFYLRIKSSVWGSRCVMYSRCTLIQSLLQSVVSCLDFLPWFNDWLRKWESDSLIHCSISLSEPPGFGLAEKYILKQVVKQHSTLQKSTCSIH